MEDLITVSNGEYNLSVYRDEDAPNPRSWANLGKMVCWHSRYSIGDEHEFDEMSDFLKSEEYKNAFVALPIYVYDFAGLEFSTEPFADKWNSHQIGYIYVSQEKAREELGADFVPEQKEIIKERLISEVRQYNQYWQGDCYAYKVSSRDGNTVFDKKEGFFGDKLTDVLGQMKEKTKKEYTGLFGKMQRHSVAYDAMM